MSDELQTTQGEDVVDFVSHEFEDLIPSRTVAVDRVFRGGLVAGVGAAGVFVGLSVLGLDTLGLALFLAGVVTAGVGLGVLGSAAMHLVRYGRPRPALILMGTVGLGVSAMVWGISLLPSAFGIFPWLHGLDFLSGLATLGFAAFVALLTIGALLRWMLTPADDEENGQASPSAASSSEDFGVNWDWDRGDQDLLCTAV